MDGARLNRLCFDGYDLLTPEPKSFHPPATDYGRYETRPVYGYDDCFPTVDACRFPGTDWDVPDHGELCWSGWHASGTRQRLAFSVQSTVLPLLFTREMLFTESTIRWTFKAVNQGDWTIPFQHVMHPLMKLGEVTDIELPACDAIYNETTRQMMTLKSPRNIKKYLLEQPKGSTAMLFLQNVKSGIMSQTFRGGMHLTVIFPEKLFSTLGIWWNNSGYPDEEGCRRTECAFEPVPGLTSNLAEAYKSKSCLAVAPGRTLSWHIEWAIDH